MNVTPSRDILLTELSKRREETIARCLSAASHTSQRLVFSHSTALLLLGAELPARIARTAREELHICCTRQEERRDLISVIPHAWSRSMDVQNPYAGLTCVGPCVAWAQLAPELSLEELTVLADALMRRDARLRLAAPDDFDEFMESAGKFPSKRKCRLAMRLMRENTDSSRETLTRLLIMRHGLPCPQVNVGVPAGVGGTLHFDMAYPDLKIAVEYQGAQHDRDLHQARIDRSRRDFLRTHGWLWLEPDNRIFLDDDQAGEFIDNLSALLSQRLGTPVIPSPLMTMEQTADARRIHNRRNARLLL